MRKRLQRLEERKKEVARNLPLITKVIRGTFIPWYGVCKNPGCRCHRDKRYLHGPYYRISYSKGRRTHHIYVPLKKKERVKTLVDNYQKVWEGIEKISALNVEMIKLKNDKDGK